MMLCVLFNQKDLLKVRNKTKIKLARADKTDL